MGTCRATASSSCRIWFKEWKVSVKMTPAYLLHASFTIGIFIGPESDHWLCLSVTNWLPNWLTDSCLVVPLAMFKRLLWLQSRITWLLRVLGKYYFADLHRIHVRLQCIYCAVKSFLSFLVSPSTAQWMWTRSHLKRVFTCVVSFWCGFI